jgi:hypothetical protein
MTAIDTHFGDFYDNLVDSQLTKTINNYHCLLIQSMTQLQSLLSSNTANLENLSVNFILSIN